MAIEGRATKEGTTRYIERFPAQMESSSYRRFRRLRAASIGIRTCLGEANGTDDKAYQDAILQAVSLGCNVIDTAITYRGMHSERVVGAAIAQLIDSKRLSRDEIIVCTKGGLIPFDAASGLSPEAYRKKTFYDAQIVSRDAEAIGHSLAPDFIRHQIEQSLKNLNLKAVDIYYLHNPEVQLTQVNRTQFYSQLQKAFGVLEQAVKEGKIGCYGIATLNGFRVEENAPEYLSLADVLKAAQTAGGPDHNFAAIQLPLSLSQTEAIAIKSQKIAGETAPVTFAHAASKQRVALFTSSSLGQGRLTRYLSPETTRNFKLLGCDTHYAVQFARSCPAVCSALVGMRQPAHVQEVLALLKVQPEAPENFVRLFEHRKDALR